MNISQPHHGNIPDEEGENEKNDAGKDEQSDEDSLFWLNFQHHPLVNSDIKIENWHKKQFKS